MFYEILLRCDLLCGEILQCFAHQPSSTFGVCQTPCRQHNPVIHSAVFLVHTLALLVQKECHTGMQSVVLPCSSFLCSYCLFSQSECRLLHSGVNKFSQMPSKTSENKTICVCVCIRNHINVSWDCAALPAAWRYLEKEISAQWA